MEINKNNILEKGYILCPYIITNPTKTDINGYAVWYDNKFKNLWLKIKRFFYTPKGLKNFKRYSEIKINKQFYGVIKFNNN